MRTINNNSSNRSDDDDGVASYIYRALTMLWTLLSMTYALTSNSNSDPGKEDNY